VHARERSYLYAYWPELDRVAHDHGIASRQAEAAFAALDAAFGRFLEAVRGTDCLILVTADHGFLDTTPEACIDLEHHPALARTLLLPLCGEGRVAYAYVRAGREAAFAAYVQSRLGERVACHPSAEVIAAGWLGPGQAHPALADRVGDYVLVPRGRCILRHWVLGEERYTHVGVHGGWSEDEMEVPLVVAASHPKQVSSVGAAASAHTSA
jgi:arylsulfatase A-like enzyme